MNFDEEEDAVMMHQFVSQIPADEEQEQEEEEQHSSSHQNRLGHHRDAGGNGHERSRRVHFSSADGEHEDAHEPNMDADGDDDEADEDVRGHRSSSGRIRKRHRTRQHEESC